MGTFVRRRRRTVAWIGLVAGLVGWSQAVPAEPPALIPRAVLFGNSQHDWPQLSPDGKRLAYLAPSAAGVVNVWVRALDGRDSLQVTRNEHEGIGLYAWAWDDRHLLYFQDRDGDENLHLWGLDLESGESRDLTPFDGVRAQNLITSARFPHQILVGLNQRDRRIFDMYRVDLATGACQLDTENPGDVLGWTADHDFVLRAASALDATDGRLTIRVRDTAAAPWRQLVTMPFGETPILGQVNGGNLAPAFASGGSSLYLATWRDSDTTRLVRVDAGTGREIETLAHDPRCDFWGAWDPDGVPRYRVMLHPQTHAVQAVAFQDMRVEWKALDRSLEADFEALRRATRPADFFVTSRDRDDRRWIVATVRADGPTSYHLYERSTRRLQLLFDDFPALRQFELAPVESKRIAARDGLSLPCYLTLPPGVPAKNLPLVLNVHGGPWTRDGWFYDPSVQWLANRGYAVLQVQYRGSSGFGKKFLNAGDRQWGVGSMQDDLTDAVRWAVKEGLADPKRVAILGGSYGGYATLAGLAFTPELYACGVDIVGPSDVATVLASFPSWWAPVKRRWILRVGDVEADAALNQRISPLHHVDAMRAPLLIGHGSNDPRVKLEQSERIAAALRSRGLPVSFIVYPDEGHGFARSENNLDFYGRAEEFLARYLGGRAEPWQAIEGSSAEVR